MVVMEYSSVARCNWIKGEEEETFLYKSLFHQKQQEQKIKFEILFFVVVVVVVSVSNFN